jgi:hypothetical protein
VDVFLAFFPFSGVDVSEAEVLMRSGVGAACSNEDKVEP